MEGSGLLHNCLHEEVALEVELVDGAKFVHLVPEVNPALPPLAQQLRWGGEGGAGGRR